MTDFEAGQQYVIDHIKREMTNIESKSKGFDVFLDTVSLLKSLKVVPAEVKREVTFDDVTKIVGVKVYKDF